MDGAVIIIHIYYLLMKSIQNRVVSKCDDHVFSLRACQKDKKSNINVTVTLCKSKQTKNKKKRQFCTNYEGPAFNKDRCYATPAFILPSEKIDYLQSTRQILRDHDKKVRQYEEQLDELYVPKPRSKSMYCNVCRESYTDYLEHIKSSGHRVCIRNCSFNTYILELESVFKPKNEKEGVNSSYETNSNDQQIEMMVGRKRIKTNLEQTNNPTIGSFFETNQNNNHVGKTTNLFLSASSFQIPYRMNQDMNNCNNFYGLYQNSYMFNPYFSMMPHGQMNMSYPMLCMPYQPMITFDMYQG